MLKNLKNDLFFDTLLSNIFPLCDPAYFHLQKNLWLLKKEGLNFSKIIYQK